MMDLIPILDKSKTKQRNPKTNKKYLGELFSYKTRKKEERTFGMKIIGTNRAGRLLFLSEAIEYFSMGRMASFHAFPASFRVHFRKSVVQSTHSHTHERAALEAFIASSVVSFGVSVNPTRSKKRNRHSSLSLSAPRFDVLQHRRHSGWSDRLIDAHASFNCLCCVCVTIVTPSRPARWY